MLSKQKQRLGHVFSASVQHTMKCDSRQMFGLFDWVNTTGRLTMFTYPPFTSVTQEVNKSEKQLHAATVVGAKSALNPFSLKVSVSRITLYNSGVSSQGIKNMWSSFGPSRKMKKGRMHRIGYKLNGPLRIGGMKMPLVLHLLIGTPE